MLNANHYRSICAPGHHHGLGLGVNTPDTHIYICAPPAQTAYFARRHSECRHGRPLRILH